MLQPSLEHTTSFDVDAPPTSSTGTVRSGGSLIERLKGLFSMARASGNGHPPDPGPYGDQKDAAGAHSMSAGGSNRREDISLEQRPSGDDHVHMVVDMLGELGSWATVLPAAVCTCTGLGLQLPSCLSCTWMHSSKPQATIIGDDWLCQGLIFCLEMALEPVHEGCCFGCHAWSSLCPLLTGHNR